VGLSWWLLSLYCHRRRIGKIKRQIYSTVAASRINRLPVSQAREGSVEELDREWMASGELTMKLNRSDSKMQHSLEEAHQVKVVQGTRMVVFRAVMPARYKGNLNESLPRILTHRWRRKKLMQDQVGRPQVSREKEAPIVLIHLQRISTMWSKLL